MVVEGVDYSFARPDPAGLAAAGKRFAARYVGVGSPGKRLSSVEAQRLATAGLSIVALCEQSAQSALLGRNAGRTHAASALLEATACGMPMGRPIYFAVDFDATPAQLSTVLNYFEGVAEVLYPRQVGAYGGIRTIRYLFDHGAITWGFQTYAWSAGQWEPRAQLRQYRNGATVAGGTVDLCHGMTVDYGQWRPEEFGTPGEDDDMATAEEVWGADLVPVGGDPANPTWQARNALGYAVDLAKDARAQLEAIRATLAAHPSSAVTLSPEDRESIIQEVVEAVVARIGLIPTAEEIARLTADKIHQRMEA